MGNLVKFFLDRPVLVKLIVLAFFVFGGSTIYRMQKEGFPNITFKSVFITTVYPGAAAGDVELNVTVPLEEAVEEVDGIDEIKSVSVDSISTIEAIVDENATEDELKDVYDDIEARISQMDNLPAELKSRPALEIMTSHDIPIIEIAFSGEYNELKKVLPGIKNRLKKISDVSAVDIIGLPDEELHILVDPVLARRYQVGLRAIYNAIRSRNIEGSGGTLESFIGEKKVVSVNKYKDYSEVLETYLRVSDLGYSLQLKQLASIDLVPEEINLRVRNNGQPGASMLIKKRKTADIIVTLNQVKAALEKEKLPAGISYVLLNDQSTLTRSRLSLVTSNAALGLFLVTIILFLVFDFKTAFWTAFGIPFAFMGAFILLNFFDVTLNMLTLGGFIIVLGMLVDDAIIVAENIISYREKGLPPVQAAVEAVKDIWAPVLGAATTTMVAFTPLLALGGMPGQFIFIIPLIVILALTAALFDSYFILPVHLSHGKHKKDETRKKKLVIVLENFYRKALTRVMKIKYPVFGFFVLMLVGAIFTARFVLKQDPFPQEAAESFTIKYTLEKGSSFEATRPVAERIEKYLKELPANETTGFSTRLGTHSASALTDRGSQHNIGVTFVYLTPLGQRDRDIHQIMHSLREKINADSYLKKNARVIIELIRFGPPLGKDFEVRVSANDEKLRSKVTGQIKQKLSRQPGILSIEDDVLEGKNQLNVLLNYKALSMAGLSVEDIMTTLRIAFDGLIVTDLISLDKTVDFRLRFNEKGRANEKYIRSLPIQNYAGMMINLDPFVRLVEQPGQGEYRHVNGKRTTTVSGTLDKDKMSGEDVIFMIEKEFSEIEDVEITYAGQPVETTKIFSDLGIAAAMALLGVYIIITLIFKSFFQPVIIMAAIPFGIIGVMLALLSHGLPISMLAGVGMVGLVGIIVNDSIVMVHTINKLKQAHDDSNESLVEGAVSRLRPILLTTITTVLGLLPTAYGIGGYDPFVAHICLAMSYGLLFATLVILFLVPVFFAMGHDIQQLFTNRLSKNNSPA